MIIITMSVVSILCCVVYKEVWYWLWFWLWLYFGAYAAAGDVYRSVGERYECDARCETAKKQEKCWD